MRLWGYLKNCSWSLWLSSFFVVGCAVPSGIHDPEIHTLKQAYSHPNSYWINTDPSSSIEGLVIDPTGNHLILLKKDPQQLESLKYQFIHIYQLTPEWKSDNDLVLKVSKDPALDPNAPDLSISVVKLTQIGKVSQTKLNLVGSYENKAYQFDFSMHIPYGIGYSLFGSSSSENESLIKKMSHYILFSENLAQVGTYTSLAITWDKPISCLNPDLQWVSMTIHFNNSQLVDLTFYNSKTQQTQKYTLSDAQNKFVSFTPFFYMFSTYKQGSLFLFLPNTQQIVDSNHYISFRVDWAKNISFPSAKQFSMECDLTNLGSFLISLNKNYDGTPKDAQQQQLSDWPLFMSWGKTSPILAHMVFSP